MSEIAKHIGNRIRSYRTQLGYSQERLAEISGCHPTYIGQVEYTRIPEETLTFKPQTDYHKWKATVFHLDEVLENLAKDFISTDEELALFQIVGHSYDLDTENMWDKIEGVFKEISSQNDILPMTTIEVIDYLKAMEQAEITDSHIINHSEQTLWFSVNDAICKVAPKNKITFG